MALLVADGFDGWDKTGTFGLKGFDYVASNITFSSTYGRRVGSKGIAWGDNQKMLHNAIPNQPTIIFGIALKKVQANSADTYNSLLQLVSGGTNQVHVRTEYVDGDNHKISVRQGSNTGTQLGITTATFLMNEWHYLEGKIVIHPTAGSVLLHLDQTEVLNLTGINTDPAGSGYADRLELWANFQTYFDDFYILDGTGSAPFNDFLNDPRIDAEVMKSDGADQDFTLSTGTSAYALLDEIPQSDTDYLTGGTVGDRVSTKINATDDGRTVLGACIHAFVVNPDAGSRGIKLFAKHGASETQSSEFLLTSTGKRVWQCLEADPDGTGQLTYSDLNAIEYGVEVTS